MPPHIMPFFSDLADGVPNKPDPVRGNAEINAEARAAVLVNCLLFIIADFSYNFNVLLQKDQEHQLRFGATPITGGTSGISGTGPNSKTFGPSDKSEFISSSHVTSLPV